VQLIISLIEVMGRKIMPFSPLSFLEREQKIISVIIIVLNVFKCKPFTTLKIFMELHKTWYGICVTEY